MDYDFYVVHCIPDICETSNVNRIFKTREEAENWLKNYDNINNFEYIITGEKWGEEIDFVMS